MARRRLNDNSPRACFVFARGLLAMLDRSLPQEQWQYAVRPRCAHCNQIMCQCSVHWVSRSSMGFKRPRLPAAVVGDKQLDDHGQPLPHTLSNAPEPYQQGKTTRQTLLVPTRRSSRVATGTLCAGGPLMGTVRAAGLLLPKMAPSGAWMGADRMLPVILPLCACNPKVSGCPRRVDHWLVETPWNGSHPACHLHSGRSAPIKPF